MMNDFTHIDSEGRVRMVDVSDKPPTFRTAVASGAVSMNYETFEKITKGGSKKGNVLETARIAGIMAAKKCGELIPMCHPLNISHVQIDFFPKENPKKNKTERKIIEIKALVSLCDKTGVEMEALTAVSIAALTIYDMCKSYDRGMIISNVRLMEKSGGASGTFKSF
jgi:cyclic pyranopterin monophosphate synthase